MENPLIRVAFHCRDVDRGPNVAFHGTFRKGNGAQIGLESPNGTKWCISWVLLWRTCVVWATRRVVGLACCLAYLLPLLYERVTTQVLVRVEGGCRATGMDREKGGSRH